jgi:Uma2 family endonuclease
VLYVARERRHILRDQCEGAPDVVIEILSPGNTPKKVQEKLEDYAKLGVPEVWYAAPKSRTLEVLILERGKYRSNGISSPGHAVNSVALEGFVLPRNIFDPED